MNMKMMSTVIIVFLIIGIAAFAVFVIKGTGYEEETSWGSWYQEYTAYYVDGGSSSLSFYHNDNEVASVEYVLKASLNQEYGTVGTFNFNDFSIQAKTDAAVISTIDFTGEFELNSDDGQTLLFTKTVDLSMLKEMENGTYMIDFVPVGSILLDGEITDSPSKASVLVRVGEPIDEENDDGADDKEINFKSDIIWN